MRQIEMTEIQGSAKVTVTVDDSQPIDSGGFGTIYAVEGSPDIVVKRLYVDPPKHVDEIWGYTAHITVTKRRLQDILEEELAHDEPRNFIIDYIRKIFTYSLSTHYACDFAGMKFSAVWLLQRRAPGLSLKAHFDTTVAPSHAVRKRVAREFVARMRTLRRADLVHLDCVQTNVFLQLSPFQVTAIDLDGCGIVRRGSAGRSPKTPDAWEYPPVTLGHIKLVRLPVWYPQPGLDTGPRRGNYLFAERWVVLDTIIRILTWGQFDAFRWLEDPVTRKSLATAHAALSADLARLLESNPDRKTALAWWTNAWRERTRALEIAHRASIRTPDAVVWVSRGHPGCLSYFANLMEQAYFDPSVLTSQSTAPLYETFVRQLD